ncbi:MAG: class I tRNA ligase family protein [Nanoarchaeota archaeon]|nr:class I tRNA ligase family protein [Nanoarchaeota archaeon]
MSKQNNFENKYEAKEQEQEIMNFWNTQEIYKFNLQSSKVVFSIDTPPPTMSGRMHIGHAFSYAQTDFIARYKRMNGFEVFYPFGTDDNGLATEKIVQKEKNIDLRKVSRQEAVKITMEYIEKTRPQFVQDWKNLGISCDFENLGYSTISPYAQKVSQQSFLELVSKGLIQRRKGPIPWDRMFQTTIAQAELEDKEVKSKMNYIKAKVVNSEHTYIIYATTRPEMIFACHGFSVEEEGDYVKLKVNVNGQEEHWIFGAKTYEEKLSLFNIEYEVIETLKGKNFIGESVMIPLINREIEVTHDESIKADLGTGSAYFCSFGGLEDIEYIKRHPEMKIYEIMNKDGTLNELCGDDFNGLIASEEGRFTAMRKLKELSVLIGQESITQIVNVGERSGVPVEYIASEQWFVTYLDKKEMFFEFANAFKWTPEFMKSRIENWIKGLNWDWGFSRQRHFGVPIPAWINIKTNSTVYPTKDILPLDPTSTPIPQELCEEGFSPKDYRGEEDVFDTWFTSASTPQLSLNLVEDGMKKHFPMDLRPQGHDIINFWLFYTMAKNNLIYDRNPFNNVAISGWVLAPDGSKMSKSKGNGIDPQDIVSKFSNDALRFAAASNKLGYDSPFQEKEVKTGLGVANKIYNSVKFASMLLEDFTKEDRNFNVEELTGVDRAIISLTQHTIKEAQEAFEKFDYAKAKSTWTGFFMAEVADNYLEIVKQRLWQKQDNYKSAQKTLYYVLINVIKGLAPIMPFITESVYQRFFKEFEDEESIHISSYPQLDTSLYSQEDEEQYFFYTEVLRAVRKYKAEKQISMKEPLEEIKIYVNEELQQFIEENIQDLRSVTNTENITFERGEFKVDMK